MSHSTTTSHKTLSQHIAKKTQCLETKFCSPCQECDKIFLSFYSQPQRIIQRKNLRNKVEQKEVLQSPKRVHKKDKSIQIKIETRSLFVIDFEFEIGQINKKKHLGRKKKKTLGENLIKSTKIELRGCFDPSI